MTYSGFDVISGKKIIRNNESIKLHKHINQIARRLIKGVFLGGFHEKVFFYL